MRGVAVWRDQGRGSAVLVFPGGCTRGCRAFCVQVDYAEFSEYGGDRVGGEGGTVIGFFRGYARCGPRIVAVGSLAFSFCEMTLLFGPRVQSVPWADDLVGGRSRGRALSWAVGLAGGPFCGRTISWLELRGRRHPRKVAYTELLNRLNSSQDIYLPDVPSTGRASAILDQAFVFVWLFWVLPAHCRVAGGCASDTLDQAFVCFVLWVLPTHCRGAGDCSLYRWAMLGSTGRAPGGLKQAVAFVFVFVLPEHGRAEGWLFPLYRWIMLAFAVWGRRLLQFGRRRRGGLVFVCSQSFAWQWWQSVFAQVAFSGFCSQERPRERGGAVWCVLRGLQGGAVWS